MKLKSMKSLLSIFLIGTWNTYRHKLFSATKASEIRKFVMEEWLAVSSILVVSTASHTTYYNLP
jgi:hypothetical protein